MPENLYTRLFYDLFWDRRFRAVYHSQFAAAFAGNFENSTRAKRTGTAFENSNAAKQTGSEPEGSEGIKNPKGQGSFEPSGKGGRTKTDAEIASAFDTFGNSILRLAYSYLHNMEDAEDILQETLIRYMNKAPDFDTGEHEKAWLLRVAANLAKNKIDYNTIRKTDQLKDELVAEEQNDLSFVWEAVKNLPEAERAVIHLFYQEGYATAQIAGILNEKEATVRSHLRRGRAKLKEILKEEYDFG